MYFITGLNGAVALSIWVLLFFNLAVNAQVGFKEHIIFLASESLHGRAAGTDDEQKAAGYIGNFLSKQCKAIVTHQQFTYPVDSSTRHPATNVIGVLNRRKRQTIILMAHYDHLGMGSSKALDFSHKNMVHPGADDNASGVAMVMELTRYLSGQKELPFNVIAFFPSAHEEGLFGSEYFVRSGFADSMRLALVMNFDMVGRLDTLSRMLRVGVFSNDSVLVKNIWAHDNDKLHFRSDDSNIEFSDLKYLEALRVPLLHFTTGTHQDYHRASDVAAKINFEGMNSIFDFISGFLRYLGMNNESPVVK